jgi:hypothetical protein
MSFPNGKNNGASRQHSEPRSQANGPRMTIDKLFFGYMALVGVSIGAALVADPRIEDFLIKPYFWVLIAVGLFDGGVYLLGGNTPGAMLTMPARLLGFVIGVVLMVTIPTLAGLHARFF